MTPESRILESIHSARSHSAWSPMPEHLLFLQMEKDKSKLPETPEGGVNTCEECGMQFKTESMLTYHRIGYCVGKPTEDLPPTPFQLLDEATIMLKEDKKPDKSLTTDGTKSLTTDGTLTEVTVNQYNTKRQSKLEWCRGTDGTVPPSAVKVGYDDHDQTHTYVCLAQVSQEVIPGTVIPSRKHATVALNGEEFKATEYNVLTDLDGHVTWKRCDVVGGIPRGAVRGGFDSKNLQYFIARGKAPDGKFCCGQYIPHKRQFYFAWQGTELTTKDFEFLCKKYSEQQFVKLGSHKNQGDKNTAKISRQPTGYGTEYISQDKHKLRDMNVLSNADTDVSQDIPVCKASNIEKISSSGKGEMSTESRSSTGGKGQDKNAVTRVMDHDKKALTGVMKHDKNALTKAKTKTSAPKELTKSGTGIITKEENKTTNSRELKNSGSAVNSKDKNKASNSRNNSGIHSERKTLQS